MPNIRAIVFDFYETLVQLTAAQRETLFDSVAQELGLDLPSGEAYHHWAVYTTRDADLRLGGTERLDFEHGHPPFITFGDVWRHRSVELLRHWASDAHEHLIAEVYVRAHATAPLYPDVRPAIESLRERYELAVLSDADTDFIVGALAHNDLSFDTIVTSEDVGVYKPHVSIFREVCARLGVEPEEAAYVGDSPWADVAGARNAGMRAVWLNRHAHDWPQDIDPPEAMIKTLAELAAVLG